MKSTLAAIVFVATFAGAALLASCRLPPPVSPGAKLIDCGKQSIKDNWPKALPAVNGCLGDGLVHDVSACLLGLINPALGLTYDVVMCLVHERGSESLHASLANPNDAISTRAASRAHSFIADQQVTFVAP